LLQQIRVIIAHSQRVIQECRITLFNNSSASSAKLV